MKTIITIKERLLNTVAPLYKMKRIIKTAVEDDAPFDFGDEIECNYCKGPIEEHETYYDFTKIGCSLIFCELCVVECETFREE